MSGMTPLCIPRFCAADPTSRMEVYVGSSHVAVAAKTSSHGDVQVQVYLDVNVLDFLFIGIGGFGRS